MPLYLLYSEEGQIVDVIQSEDCDNAQTLVNTIPTLCNKLDDTTPEQIKIAKGDAIISEISAELARAMNNLIEEYKSCNDVNEPLDGDEVEKLSRLFNLFAQPHEVNLTDEEYSMAISELK